MVIGDATPQIDGAAGTCTELQASEGGIILRQDHHDAPVTSSEATRKGPKVHQARLRRIPWMRVDPDAGRVLWGEAGIGHLIEVVRHGGIIEDDRERAAPLLDESNVVDEEQIILIMGYPEPADFGRAEITEEAELGPRCRGEAKRRSLLLEPPGRLGTYRFQ